MIWLTCWRQDDFRSDFIETVAIGVETGPFFACDEMRLCAEWAAVVDGIACILRGVEHRIVELGGVGEAECIGETVVIEHGGDHWPGHWPGQWPGGSGQPRFEDSDCAGHEFGAGGGSSRCCHARSG